MVSGPSASSAVGGPGRTSANASAKASPSARASPAVGASAAPGGASKAKPAQVNSNGYHPPKAANPFSSMRSAPLDMSLVERRGQPTACQEPVQKKSRPHDLQEAPTYRATEEEWKDPFLFISNIRPEAEKYGVCKVIPPKSWNPPFAIDTERFHFRTRKQELNSVEGTSRTSQSYQDGIAKYHKQYGSVPGGRMPQVDKKPLNLYKLKKAVEQRGGLNQVIKLKKWAEIGRELGYSGKIMSSLSTSLRTSYEKFIDPYEAYLKMAKPGVHQQLELKYGGPLTPSPAPSPMKRSTVHTPMSARDDSPARNATDALQASINGHAKDADRDTPMPDAGPASVAEPSGGFTAINTGGFTAVNAGFTSVNRPLVAAADAKTTTPNNYHTPQPSSKNTPEYRPAGPGPTGLKRQMSYDSTDSTKKDSTDQDEGDAGSRRSKRLKKGTVPTVAGSHMSVFRPSAPRISREETATPEDNCEQCGKGGDDGNFMLICDSCDHGYHGTCLDPPISAKPPNEWNCPRCLVGDGEFGFEEGGLYSLKQFQEKAFDFKQSYFENKMPVDPKLNCHRPVTEQDVEQEFWRLVADSEEDLTVEYGADIHCTTHGSGFPTMEKDPKNPYSTDPWNLNLLPLHPDSLFRHIKSDISGMTVPWVYVGMMFSTFCWHNEDHYAYSANYQHFGATKTWYGIPAEDSEKFENAMREAVPELFETQPDLLFQLVTLMPPEQLKKAGVRVYALDQRAGEFVITFPRAYHAGFNHGFNFNEAVNFAPSDWEPYGLEGVQRLQSFRRQPCFSHDELLWTAAEGITSGGLTIQTARWLAPALDRIHKRELSQRNEFIGKHSFIADARISSAQGSEAKHNCPLRGEPSGECPLIFKTDDVDVPEEEYTCSYCKAFSYLSRFVCLKTGKVLCLLHAAEHGCCERPKEERYMGTDHALYFRKSDEVMSSTYKKVADKAHLPEAWEEKYQKLLDEDAVMPLKAMRALLSEGEKIPYELPSLPAVRSFVDSCNHWVEEAANYTVRKQQNRRKSEKTWQITTRKSVGNAAQAQKEREMRNVSNIDRLLVEAAQIGFDCPEIVQLQERAEAIKAFQLNAGRIIKSKGEAHEVDILEELLEEGQSFNIDMPELEDLARRLDQARWYDKAKAKKRVMISLEEVQELINEGKRLDIEPYDDLIRHYEAQLSQGMTWEKKALELINAESVHYPQLQALSNQAQENFLPVSAETLASVDQILHKQREAHRQIVDLNERSKSADYHKRPKYSEVAEIMKKVEELQAKPQGTLDLEKEQKRHEDWMRKGKKLFGKTNAPLHILKSHMEYVLDRNVDCFNIEQDRPRGPAEPSSREQSPDGASRLHSNSWEDPSRGDVFCICRRPEQGMMIECEMCHEWYHGKCLKIARGKVKDEDKYTCPICDWRVKIPRDAARPKLEELVQWRDEIPGLPFQPEEAELLNKIIDNAQDFRNHIAALCNPVLSQRAEAEVQRFFLRKIEGAEVLLAHETNFFRQELHKWCPVAPDPPPVLDQSKSTRKPRPTKLQKLLQQYNVDDPDDLPEEVKGKANSLKRKALNAAEAAAAANSGMSTSPRGTGYPYYSRNSSTQPQTPGLSIGSNSHVHPGHGPDSASVHGHHRSGSNAHMDAGQHHAYFMKDTTHLVSPQLLIGDHHSAPTFEDRVAQGSTEIEDLLHTEEGKIKALEIFSRTEVGRHRAEEIFGPDIWNHPGAPMVGNRSMPTANDPLGIGMGNEDDNHMFADLMNDDDNEESERHKTAEHSHFENMEVDRHEMESSVDV
ncbi:Lid2 complex component lid2 [Rhypophila decipiens]